ncbi:MAG: FAD-binding oxidoreductase [Candidatus Rokubacteria bacterium]|nr:FAD-binding oxidoreductase [Candidatus Rokubacteria bacterium]
MSETASVVIVGGGVMGASTAFHLAERGCRDVTLLERQGVASGPTGHSSALLRQHYSIEIYARLAYESLQFYHAFRERVGGDCGLIRCGLAVAIGPDDLEPARETVRMQQAIGIQTEFVPLETLRDLFGEIRTDDLAAGVFEAMSGYAEPVTTTMSFVRRARELGVRVLEDRPALEILVAGGRVTGVRTPAGILHTDTVVLAAGPWTLDLVRPLELDFPLRASRQQVVLFGRPEPRRPQPVLVDMVQACYFRPEVDHQVFVGVRNPAGVVADADPDRYDPRVNGDAVERAAILATHRFPHMERAEWRGGYAAIYDLTPDLHFVIDRPRTVEGLLLATGFSGHGFKHAPMIGRLLAEWVLDGQPKSADLTPFSLDRFRTGTVLRGRYARWPY